MEGKAAMWEMDFGVIEQARANRHGRQQTRREERRLCDVAVTIFRDDGESATGWALDRSASGARVLLSSDSPLAIGEQVTMEIGEDFQVFRIVWAQREVDTYVLGLARVAALSGEFPVLHSHSENEEVTRVGASLELIRACAG